jgi:hypothetical protein
LRIITVDFSSSLLMPIASAFLSFASLSISARGTLLLKVMTR